MVSDPWENPLGPEETFNAFDSTSEPQGPSSGASTSSTDENTATHGSSRPWNSAPSEELPRTIAEHEGRSTPEGRSTVLFGKYLVRRKLGDGGMGDVWLVEHIGLGAERALKIIKANIADGNASGRLRFQREAKILAQLGKHPNAVVVHDFGIDGDEAYIEMEALEGRTLSKWLKAKPKAVAPVGEVLWFLRELCQVMGEAHRRGIVHRDIKPGNIMIVDDPTVERGERVKVLDFGIAKIVRDAEGDTAPLTMQTKGYLGTLPYSSPEQLGIDADGREGVPVDHRSDIYSIGVLLYEMLAGTLPFTGSATKIVYDHAYTPPTPILTKSPEVEVPPQVEKVVMRCLEKQPAHRPQSAQELYESFAAAVPEHLVSQTGGRPAWSAAAPSSAGGTVDRNTACSTSWNISRAASLLTQIGLPSYLPRKAILRLFLGLALGAGVVSGLLALYLNSQFGPGTRSGRASMETLRGRQAGPAVPAWVKAYLESRGFRPSEAAGTDKDGWPARIERPSGAGPGPMVLRGNLYLPGQVQYAPEAEEASAEGLPRALVRDFDKARFLLIEGGEFEMGAWEDPRIPFSDDEKPGHFVEVPSYYMQETEVTCKEIRDFPLAPPKTDPKVRNFWVARDDLRKRMEEPEWEQRPAVGITRRLAEDYAHYVGGELPTEPQWEFAARSRGQKRPFVWPGNEVSEPNGEYRARIFAAGQRIDTLTVRLPESDRTEQGVYGLAGNVREWCRDVWQRYPARSTAEGPNPTYAIRGGSFETPPETARVTWRSNLDGQAAVRYRAEADKSFLDVGFRVVLDAIAKRPPPKGALASKPPRKAAP